MPYARILDELIGSIPEAQAALLLDTEGEVVVETGARDERHRLIGAYQGIALAFLRKTVESYECGGIEYLLCRYDEAAVILRPLRDGYYLIVALGRGSRPGEAIHRSKAAQDRMNQEI